MGAVQVSAAPLPTAPGADLVVSSIEPIELTPGGSVTIRGEVRGGEDGLEAAQVSVRRASNRSDTVSSLQRWTAPVDPLPGPAVGRGELEDPAATARTEGEVAVGDVPASSTVPFSVRLEAEELDLPESSTAAGSYGLQLLLTTSTEVVDDERGFLVWSPPVDASPTSVVVTVPLTAPPVLAETGLPDPDVLRGEVADGGRLDNALAVAGTLDADWVLDPTLLAGLVAAQTAAGAEATVPSGTPSPATDPTDGASPAPSPTTDPTADPTEEADGDVVDRWLAELREARGVREVVLSDWADPDPARLQSATDPAAAWATLTTAQQRALPAEEVERLVDGRTRDDVLVATDDGASQVDLAALSRGRTTALMHEEAVPLQDPFGLSYTPDQVSIVTATEGRQLKAVLADQVLGDDLAAAVEGSPLSLTRVVARLATTTLQRPNDPRLLAIHLPDTLRPADGATDAVAAALDDTGWARTVRLSTALGTPPSTEAREPLPDGGPLEPHPGVQQMLDAVADSRLVADAVNGPQQPEEDPDLPLQTAAALSRHVDPDTAEALATDLASATQQTVDAIRVVPGSRITLVAAQAALPVTVVNELTSPVELVLDIRSRSPRLQVSESKVPVTVAPGQRTVVEVPVVAVASGPADVSYQLVTALDRPWGAPSTVTVTVATQAEGRVLAAIGVVIALLFVLGAGRAFIRNRRGRELDATEPDAS